MKRDAVKTCLLLANACLLVYIAILVWQRPSLYDIDARIEYWHNYYHEFDQSRLAKVKRRDETNAPAVVESAATASVPTLERDENATVPDLATSPSNGEQSSGVAPRLPSDEN